MSEPKAINFSSAEPVSHDQDVADREVDDGGVRWAIVEYQPGAGRADWCDTPHVGYVISGAIRYEFEDGREPLAIEAGEGFSLPPEPRHRGRNEGSDPVRLFLIDALPAG
jgi:quercetin dioxygenase-like cupin family protein